jgi:hypothetical protein
VRKIDDDHPAAWTLPWAILPEVDYPVARYPGARVRKAFVGDLAAGSFEV